MRYGSYSNSSASHEDGRVRISPNARGDYTDGGDESDVGDLLLLDVEGE